ncbi:SUKH-4 family immunity protein [Streptomyces sp. NPDC060030]|uniref:SUKH-4 family immunity protein n=1 Tax=Streptomyces sp. NPDC060030 TaxID=3347042 RepID=UPI00367FF1CC
MTPAPQGNALALDPVPAATGRCSGRRRAKTSDTVTPVNADVSTLAFTVWMHSRQRKLEEEYELTREMGEFYHQVADTMVAVLATADPVACLPATGPDDYRYWPEVFHDEAGGVL